MLLVWTICSAFYWPDRNELPVYTTAEHGQDIVGRLSVFKKSKLTKLLCASMRHEPIEIGTTLEIGDCRIEVFHQDHGNTTSLGFLFNDRFAYSTDVVGLSEAVLDRLAGVPLWIVEALRDTPHQSHSHYEQTFAWIERVKPGRAVLTHLGLEADHSELSDICPPNTEPGVDGMVFTSSKKN